MSECEWIQANSGKSWSISGLCGSLTRLHWWNFPWFPGTGGSGVAFWLWCFLFEMCADRLCPPSGTSSNRGKPAHSRFCPNRREQNELLARASDSRNHVNTSWLVIFPSFLKLPRGLRVSLILFLQFCIEPLSIDYLEVGLGWRGSSSPRLSPQSFIGWGLKTVLAENPQIGQDNLYSATAQPPPQVQNWDAYKLIEGQLWGGFFADSAWLVGHGKIALLAKKNSTFGSIVYFGNVLF